MTLLALGTLLSTKRVALERYMSLSTGAFYLVHDAPDRMPPVDKDGNYLTQILAELQSRLFLKRPCAWAERLTHELLDV